jgi:NAD(P)-dependent dehydrogenase (short-subunit alcohol dehydrogenase family)
VVKRQARGDASRTDALFDLTGRVAVVTGGGGFLGRQHAGILASRGAKIVIVDKDAAAAREATAVLRAAGGIALPIRADLTKPAHVSALVRRTLAAYGRIDVLINNAAMTVKGGGRAAGYFAPFEDYPLDLWQRALHINLTGMFLVTQAIGRVMVKQRRGIVINMASDLGLIAPDHRIYEGESFNTPPSYSVCKSGVIGFTRYLATYWAQHGIRVNALAPAGMYDGHDARFVKKLSALIPLGRMAAKNEYQGAILFLASDASSFMTGATLVVDGGRTSW